MTLSHIKFETNLITMEEEILTSELPKKDGFVTNIQNQLYNYPRRSSEPELFKNPMQNKTKSRNLSTQYEDKSQVIPIYVVNLQEYQSSTSDYVVTETSPVIISGMKGGLELSYKQESVPNQELKIIQGPIKPMQTHREISIRRSSGPSIFTNNMGNIRESLFKRTDAANSLADDGTAGRSTELIQLQSELESCRAECAEKEKALHILQKKV